MDTQSEQTLPSASLGNFKGSSCCVSVRMCVCENVCVLKSRVLLSLFNSSASGMPKSECTWNVLCFFFPQKKSCY